MSNFKTRDFTLDEAKDFVQDRAKREAKKALLGVTAWGISKLPGGDKIESGFQKISNKIPDGFSVSIDPEGQKFSIGFKKNF